MKKIDIDEINKILVIQTAFLGDIVLTIPLLKTIKNDYPNKYLSVLTTPLGRDILKNQDFIDEIIVYDKKGKHKGLKKIFELVKEIKIKKFDLAILPHRSFRSGVIAFFSRIKYRIGFDKSENKIFLTKKIPYKFGIHEIERNFMLVDDIVKNKITAIDFPIDTEIENKIYKILDEKKFFQTKIIGVNFSSVWYTKRWPTENYAKLIKYLVDKKYNIIIFGDKKDENDFEYQKYILNDPFFSSDKILNLVGKTNIDELIAYIKNLDLYVTNDSGPMHIAAGLRIQIVAIFGPTTKELGFFPYSDKAMVVEKKLDCRPCGRHGGRVCPRQHFKCMKDISVEIIEEIVAKFL